MVPFVFDMADDLASKALLGQQNYDAYIFCHKGVRYGSVKPWPSGTSTTSRTSWRPAPPW